MVKLAALLPVPVAARSKAWVCGWWPVQIVGSNTGGGAWLSICCECCVLSGRGLCDELVTLPEESYWLWCVVACSIDPSGMCRPWPALGRSTKETILTLLSLGLWKIIAHEHRFLVPNGSLHGTPCVTTWHRNTKKNFSRDRQYDKIKDYTKLNIRVSVHHDTIYENDQQDATV